MAAALAVAASVAGSLVALALTFPALTGRVVDEAGLLDAQTKAALEERLAAFEAKTTGQLVVVTLKSLQGTSIEDYGYQLGRTWGIGDKEKSSGALLIVAPNDRKVRIEVGYGLEGNLTDAVSKLIIENSILPRFRVNDFAGGISRGVDDIIQAATVNPEEWKARARQRPDHQGLEVNLVMLIFFAIAFIMIARSMRSSATAGPRSGYGGPVFLPSPGGWSSGSSSGSGGWSSGDSGGFSGGGGSFGGGGASGSW